MRYRLDVCRRYKMIVPLCRGGSGLHRSCCNKGASDLLLTELRATLLGAVDIDDIVGKATCVRRSCWQCTGTVGLRHPTGFGIINFR